MNSFKRIMFLFVVAICAYAENGIAAGFSFAQIPEIVFVRGYAQSERMGIYQIDTSNRWKPGDLLNTDWRSKVVTTLTAQNAQLPSTLVYESDTGILKYSGGGQGSETFTVVLSAPNLGKKSGVFQIRILEPTMVWGENATGLSSKFKNAKFVNVHKATEDDPNTEIVEDNPATLTFAKMSKLLNSSATHELPEVVLVRRGVYSERFYTGKEKLNIYILGEPGLTRPKVVDSGISIQFFETAYIKNFELQNTTIKSQNYHTDRKVNLYVANVYQHDSKQNQSGIQTPGLQGAVGAVMPGEWNIWVWNFRGRLMGGASGTTHQFYVEGRPNVEFMVNNVRIEGAFLSSALKTTARHAYIRNSYFSAVADESRPAVGPRAQKLLDMIAAGEHVIYNNDIVGARGKGTYQMQKKIDGVLQTVTVTEVMGTQSGLIHFRQRREFWGSDSPAYPDISFSPPVTSLYNGGILAPPGFTAGPETYVNPKFWEAVRAYPVSDIRNKYTFKKFVSYNRFRWIDEGYGTFPAFTDDGTEPRHAVKQFFPPEYLGTIPKNWVERSVTFMGNNEYIGWTPEDDANGRFFNLKDRPSAVLLTPVGPGPWLTNTDPEGRNIRTVVDMGGEDGPRQDQTKDQPEKVFPYWFKK